MDTSLLQGIGVFVCVGAIILVVVAAFAIRALTRSRKPQNPTMWNNRGDEKPRYDDADVQSSGGFGRVPTTGRGANVFDQDEKRAGFGSGTNTGDVDRPLPQQPTRRRDRADDDDVRSSGGFGG